MTEQDGLSQQEWLSLTLNQALDGLRDGLRSFVVAVLEEKEGCPWYGHPRVQRMLPVQPVADGGEAYVSAPPVLDLALLLKLIGSDCYWYRTFSPRLPGISRWQIDSLRELRNRVAHNDGNDPLFTKDSLLVSYLDTMVSLLQVVGSEQAVVISRIRTALQLRRRRFVGAIVLGRSRWSFPFWFSIAVLFGAIFWLIDYSLAPRVASRTLVVGTPDSRLERYLPLEQFLEARLRPTPIWRAFRGEKINVRIEGARSYPEAVANLRARRWDVLLGFSPVVSMEGVQAGYRPIAGMFPGDPVYRSILFTRKDSKLKDLQGITNTTRLALGDFFSATKYYVPMSLLKGRSINIVLNLSTAEIVEQVRTGNADIGAMAGNPLRFERLNPGLKILATSTPLPQSIVGLSPDLSDLDRDQIQRALLNAPPSVRGIDAANFGPAAAPDYRLFSRQVSEGKAFSACLRNQSHSLRMHCPATDRISQVEGWIDSVVHDGERVRIQLTTADRQTMFVLIKRSILEQSAVFNLLSDLRGRSLKVLVLQDLWRNPPVLLETPHQLEIKP